MEPNLTTAFYWVQLYLAFMHACVALLARTIHEMLDCREGACVCRRQARIRHFHE